MDEVSGAPKALDSHLFRRALGQFGTGVTVVTTSHEGANYGVTSNSFASVSLEPPLVLWSIKKSSQSHIAFTQAGHFAVNILGVDQSDISGNFAKSGGDKFVGLDWRPGVGEAPVLEGTAAVFSCRRWATFDGGDHTIIVGEVLDFSHDDREALLFSQGRYARAELFAAKTEPRSVLSDPNRDAPFLAVTLRNAYGTLRNEMDGFRRDIGISHLQAAILFALRGSAGLASGQLAEQFGFGLSFDQAELGQLVSAGYVVKAEGNRFRLTQAGERILEAFLDRVREMEKAVSTGFSASEMAVVWRLLERLSSGSIPGG